MRGNPHVRCGLGEKVAIISKPNLSVSYEVSILMSEIVANHLKDKKEIKIYDPTSGSGSLLINIGHSIAKHIDNKNNIKYYSNNLKERDSISNKNGLTLHIENFINNTDKDIEQLAYELEFYRKRISMGKGGV